MPKPRRVMFISTHGYVSGEVEFGKPDTGGQVVYVLELAKCIARFGYQVDIFTRRFEDQPEQEDVAPGVQILRAPCGGDAFIPKETLCDSIPEWVENAAEMIEARGAEPYLFINSHYWDAGLAGQGLSRRLGVPHLHTPHSLGAWKRENMDGEPEALEKQYNFKRRVKEERIVFHDCEAIIATTTQQRDILLEEPDYDVPRDKVHVVPPGYDDTRFFPVSTATRQALKAQYGYEGRIVLAVGRIARNKGYDLLIKAMQKVCHRHEDVKLLLAIGSTEPNKQEQEMVKEFKTLAQKLGIGKRVIFQDYIPDEALPDYYRLCDVFALSSRYEPFGMTAVEAMACGAATVVTTEGGLWERLDWGLNALYANPFDEFEYGSAIHHVLQHERLSQQISRNGSHRARADFTWIGIAQQIVRIAKAPAFQIEDEDATVHQPGVVAPT
ncbi:MAG: glycosyltransferase [Planctomycetota bacterium]